MRARLRPNAPEGVERWLRAGRVTLDTTRRVAEVNGRSIHLSQREFLLLRHLMHHVGEVCGRDDLLSGVWGYSFDPGTNIVDVYVGRLRAKLGAPVIETIRNVGYCLHPS